VEPSNQSLRMVRIWAWWGRPMTLRSIIDNMSSIAEEPISCSLRMTLEIDSFSGSEFREHRPTDVGLFF
jgi:hypothetical protein